MAQLVSGIVPDGGRGGTGSASPNKINDSTSLALQVRSEFITLNYPLLSKLYQQFGVIQSLVEVPVLDAFRGGIKISAYEKKVVVPKEEDKKRHRFFKFWNEDDTKKKPDAQQQQIHNLIVVGTKAGKMGIGICHCQNQTHADANTVPTDLQLTKQCKGDLVQLKFSNSKTGKGNRNLIHIHSSLSLILF